MTREAITTLEARDPFPAAGCTHAIDEQDDSAPEDRIDSPALALPAGLQVAAGCVLPAP
ncbi:MAG: hypothetical protein Q8N26_37850 [Myxococcales bacterium]|nr:hypothetical protein [Myxococcales bacterium]